MNFWFEICMEIDYAKHGFRCGIEIHQRVASHHKLFCQCKTLNESEESDGTLFRKQRAVAGELGAVDAAAMHEQLRNRKFVYKRYPTFTCDVDEDQEPPHRLNQEALDVGLQVALMLKADVLDEVEVMRKSVLDGSNTGGFQRTMVIALGGELGTSKGKVRIPTICLEEEASAIQEEMSGEVIYRLDRLGIPLVEICTATDIVDPAHCRETAERLGLILRATGKVQRGIGTIRQDVNISIAGGARVEIKGAQDLDCLQALVENEVQRQLGLLELKAELKRREAKEFLFKCVDVTDLFASTESKMLRKALDKKEVLIALRLPKFGGLLGRELYPGRRFGTELSDYAKTQGVGGIIHSDEKMPKYGITPKEAEALCKKLAVAEDCAWIMIAGPEQKACRASEEAYKRAMLALKLVPEETRKVVKEGETAYMRPLPGGARLYPETDVPPVRLTKARIDGLAAVLPEMPDDTLDRLKGVLNEELAHKIFRSPRLHLFSRVMDQVKGADATVVAATLEEIVVGLKREGVAVEAIKDDRLIDLFREHFENGLFVKAAVPGILRHMAKMPGESVRDAVSTLGLKRMSHAEIEEAVKAELKETRDRGLLIKRIMEKLRLRAEGSDVVKVVNRLV